MKEVHLRGPTTVAVNKGGGGRRRRTGACTKERASRPVKGCPAQAEIHVGAGEAGARFSGCEETLAKSCGLSFLFNL